MSDPILTPATVEISLPVRAEIQRVLATEGFYIAMDVNQPGANIPLAVMGGKIYSMCVDAELAPDRFYDTVRFKGPYRGDVSL